MSRSGYSDDIEDQWQWIRWRGQVASAIRGKRGQRLLKDMAEALDAMPEKILITEELQKNGCVCALGALAAHKGIPVGEVDPWDTDEVAKTFDVASPLSREIVFENDEGNFWHETPEQRWVRMRNWVQRNIIETKQGDKA